MDDAAIDALLRAMRPRGADLGLVEGNKGLYDGLALDGSNSNAALAQRLGLPVLLVIDARGMTRGIAPLILGYQAFDRDIRIGGVILNQLGGARHEAKLRAVIEHYTDVPVLGAVAEDARLAVMRAPPRPDALRRARRRARSRAGASAACVAEQVDLDRVRRARGIGRPLAGVRHARTRRASPRARRRRCASASRATARSASTTPTTWRRCEAAGAELVPIDTLRDAQLAGGRRPVHRRRLSRGVHGRRWRPMPRCAPSCARPSKPACRPTPNAAG